MAIDIEHWKNLWATMGSTQRIVIAGGTLAAIVGVGALVKTMGGADYKPLMTGLEAEDAQAITQQLAVKQVQYRLSPDGKEIDVEADKLDEARMDVASQGSAHSGRMGFELFDKTSWGQTEFDEKVNYQRALEGELERTIGTLGGVKSARVHLVMPHSSVFMDKERAAKASVTLKLRRGNMSDQQLESIARLVSAAVDNLAPADVTIVDADNNRPLNSHSGAPQGRELEAEMTKRLLDTLGPVVGVDNMRASVNVEYDLKSSEESQDQYDPQVSALLTTEKTSEQTGNGAPQGGVAGTSSNIARQQGQADPVLQGDATNQTSMSENSTYGVNKIERHIISPAGQIRRISAAILVNDRSDKKLVHGELVGDTFKRSPEQLKDLQTLASAVLGADSVRGDVVTVENMTFVGADEPDVPLPVADRIQRTITQFATPLRYLAMLALFLLCWALIFRPLQKHALASLAQAAVREIAAPQEERALTTPNAPPFQLPDPLLQELAEDVSTVGLKRTLSEMVHAEPAAMARTVQTWLQE
jgi:flagellar M-ring protein FliF